MNKLAAIGCVLAVAAVAFVAGRQLGGRSAGDHGGGERKPLYYVDPMHPSYRSEKPGTAPDCGMDLVPVFEDAGGGSQARPPAAGSFSVDPQTLQLIGVQVDSVRRGADSRVARTTGRIEVDGDRLYRLMAGADGWVESVQNNPVGTLVKKDELLATLYSREFRNAQQAFLGSLASLDRLKAVHDQGDASAGSDAALKVNEEQLRALGMGDYQLRELRRDRRITSDISVNSPIDGIVLNRAIAPGQRFEVGTELYQIADLGTVWITADILGLDPAIFRPGGRVRVVVRDRPATVTATVGNAPPFFDPEARTLKVRLSAANPGLVLRPGMFVTLEVPVPGRPALTVPADALLDSGLSERVYVERAAGQFEPREVTTGWRDGDRVEILDGLREGERIAVAGTFLLDSESRLRMARAGGGKAAVAQAGATDPRCGMSVDVAAAAAAGLDASYGGRTYYFCSGGCKEEFERDPAKYALAGGQLAASRPVGTHD
ncbi:MAG: efflux RND transporter periplasmic adaptor subunit [Acidobacteria bacterium]|nr:efflux RND transporter periplasmic adaptor subunit [Acidobacteriota bacterium]